MPATRNALSRAGLSTDDLDVIESNEAFAAQACAVSKELGFDPAKVNPNGSGISLGHPVGATGAIITTKLVYELHRAGAATASPPCASAADKASRRSSSGFERRASFGLDAARPQQNEPPIP